MKNITILGSTGSIGTQALDVIDKLNALAKRDENAPSYKVLALTAHTNMDLLEKQVRMYEPVYVCVTDQKSYEEIKLRLRETSVTVLYGMDGLCEAASLQKNDLVLNALVGMVGLRPTLAAIGAKKDVALANKETLVAGGQLVMQAARENHVKILPVDSEHSAIFQCLAGHNSKEYLHKLLLTASGGAFYGRKKETLRSITVEQALTHPNWQMGAKVTIDSATLMNKGLELIEAAWLFDVDPKDIEIVVHRESIVHSMVRYVDGSVIAQMGVPDMRIPIQYALTWPARFVSPVKPLDLVSLGSLSFGEPDEDTFLCLPACREAIRRGGLYPCIVNGANEQAVKLFLDHEIGFLQIGELVRDALNVSVSTGSYTVEDVLEADRTAREAVLTKIR
ncbi:1-deoxy-D-xylulose-5-phosphate reductoisomerase [Candidatus Soleaferrea massiliensis]|uniref:1-deoxy-D-xylulose-5-phosphate reductoisomerase n=1 Tax=Candidatus Soleaferrea massiliensis TaxID=1470354 RepID=UPI00058C7F7F|nr:1-deoxy-D-xylulose-5-phosphate reductoisomerase [Candidatus Soleaferrea massiliensis]